MQPVFLYSLEAMNVKENVFVSGPNVGGKSQWTRVWVRYSRLRTYFLLGHADFCD